jgi:hypothetical protein
VAGDDTRRRGWKRFLPKDPWTVVIGPIIVVLVGAGVTLLVSSGGSSSEAKKTDLQALPPVVQNPRRENESAGKVRSGPAKGAEAFRQTNASKPRVEIRLHNLGTQRADLTSARFTIRRFATIRPCGQGAAVVVSAQYDVTLPERAGATVEVPIRQELGADEVDDFAFRITSRNYDRQHAADVLVYELDVSVMHDNSPDPLPVGRVVVAIPGAPDVGGFNPGFRVPGQSACPMRPPPEQRAAATFDGVMSPELDRYLRFLRTAGGGTA